MVGAVLVGSDVVDDILLSLTLSLHPRTVACESNSAGGHSGT